MTPELSKQTITLAKVEQISGYSKDYLAEMSRRGDIPAFKTKRNWKILKSDIEMNLDLIKDGAAKRLMLSDLSMTDIEQVPFKYRPIAFLASKRKTLDQLNQLFDLFDIEKHGTCDFKKRLNEKTWIAEAKEAHDKTKRELVKEISKKSPMSALSELAVAQYIKNESPHSIIKMAASSMDANSDVVTDDADIEVKYFADSPEWRKNVLDNLDGKSVAISIDDDATINYYYIRIAEAAIQLKKQTSNKKKIVWLVFNQTASEEMTEFVQDDMNFQKWRPGIETLIDRLFRESKENEERKEIISKTPHEWLKEIDCLVLSIFEQTWSLSNVHLLKDSLTKPTPHQPKSSLY